MTQLPGLAQLVRGDIEGNGRAKGNGPSPPKPARGAPEKAKQPGWVCKVEVAEPTQTSQQARMRHCCVKSVPGLLRDRGQGKPHVFLTETETRQGVFGASCRRFQKEC